VDPVCGRKLAKTGAEASAEYKRRRYFFCSEKCRHAFERQTEWFRLHELAKAGALMTPGRVRWGLA
jgi:YHS domain-containing protein